MNGFPGFTRSLRRLHAGAVVFHVCKALVAVTAFVLLWHEASAF